MIINSDTLSASQLVVIINYDLSDARRKKLPTSLMLLDSSQPIDKFKETIPDAPPFVEAAYGLDTKHFTVQPQVYSIAIFSRMEDPETEFIALRGYLSSRKLYISGAGGITCQPPTRLREVREAAPLCYSRALENLAESHRSQGVLVLSNVTEFLPRDLI